MFELEQDEVVGASGHSSVIRRFIEEAAHSAEPVVLLGEPGVGKEFTARQIHQRSPRRDHPFLIVDCSLYYERELKRELFGYHGVGRAPKSRKGLLEFAAKGTCYLSRVEELSPGLQQGLLGFLRTGRFRRLGDGKEITADGRLIVSSAKNLAGFVQGGLFDADLYRELSRLSLVLPPLRERPEDIREMVRVLGEAYSRSRNLPQSPEFAEEVLEALECFPWPGNHDELKKEVLHLLDGGARRITPDRLSLEISSYWIGRRGDIEVRRVLEELDGYIREFKVLSRLDAEFGDVLLNALDWGFNLSRASRQLGEHLL